jgi:hypothetical protein
LVSFQWEEISECESLADLESKLKDLPPSLEAMYDQMISRIKNNYCKHVVTILQWLAFSVWPLQLEEVAEATIIDSNIGVDVKKRFDDPEAVLRMCSGLIVKDSKGKTTGCELLKCYSCIL